MPTKQTISIVLIAILALGLSCKEVYLPPVVQEETNLLVVDGFINTGGDSSIIKLSRSRPVGSGGKEQAELRAVVELLSPSGTRYPFTERPGGVYARPPLGNVQGQSWRLRIRTVNGKEYLSDPVLLKITPPIDSLEWARTEEGVTIYTNTHDDLGLSKYYNWQFVETWEYRTVHESETIYDHPNLRPRRPEEQIYICYSSDTARNYSLGSSDKLSTDVISRFPLILIPPRNVRLGFRYSILVKQMVFTREGFEYWETFSKMTEKLGSIFDVQPAELVGNIHCLSNPAEPVIGYLSGYSVTEKRIFIDYTQLPDWNYHRFPFPDPCDFTAPPPGMSLYDFFGPGTDVVPIKGITSTSLAYGDCRVQGGKTQKPPFW